MQNLHARLTPWAVKRITKDYGKVNKTTLRKSLRDFPGTEFWTIATPEYPRNGATFTVTEVAPANVEVYTVDDQQVTRLLAVVTVHPSGSAVVS